MYRSVLRDNKTEYLLRTADQSDNRMRITELFPGEMYEVQVMCTSHNLDSELREATTVFGEHLKANFPCPFCFVLSIKNFFFSSGSCSIYDYSV